MRTRRFRHMDVSGCSGAEASECGSRGRGFVYASAAEDRLRRVLGEDGWLR